jgi:hypothetical protein
MIIPSATGQKNSLLTNSLCLLFLIGVGVKWAWGLSTHNDILFGDEVEYMRNGMDLFSIIRNDWGPAYNIWYKVLSFFTSDPIQLYFLNYAAGSILAGVLLYVVLTRYRFNQTLAVYLSLCFLISETNINTWPRVSHFIVIVLLTGLIASTYLTSVAKKCLVFSTTCFIASYARPDLLFAFFIILSITIFYVYQERSNFKSLIPYFFLLLISILFFQCVFGLPASNYRGDVDRLYIAFGQHFTINYKSRTHAQMDAVTDWLVFCRNYFPGCHTFGDIVKTHWHDIVQNSWYNFKNYLLTLIGTVTSFIFPLKLLYHKKISYVFLAGFTGGLLYIFFKTDKRKSFYHLLFQHRLTLFFLFIFGLSSIGMCVIIFPRQHYILLHSVLLIFILACIGQCFVGGLNLKWYIYVVLFTGVLLFSPTAGKYKYLLSGNDTKNLCSQKLIRYLSTKTDQPYVIFSSVLNISYPLPKNFSEFNTEYELKEGMQFSQVLNEKHINMIFMLDNLIKNPVLKKDTTWIQFLNDPQKYQFKRIKYSDICESYLLVKDNTQQ